MTFGALGAYAEVMRYRYIYSHTVLNGKHLKFRGSWTDLFLLNFKWGFLSVVTLGIYLIWRMTRKQQWVTANVAVEDAPDDAKSEFTASIGGNFGNSLGWGLLTIITLGILSFMAHAHRNRYVTTHSVISSGTLNYTVTGPKYFVKSLVWTLLTLITFGIYGIWVVLRRSQYEVANTNFDNPNAVPRGPMALRYDSQTGAPIEAAVQAQSNAAAFGAEQSAAPQTTAEDAVTENGKKKKVKLPFTQEKSLKIAILVAGISAFALMTLVPLLGGMFAELFNNIGKIFSGNQNPYENSNMFYLETVAYRNYQQALGLQIFALIAAVPLAILIFMRKFDKNWIASGVFTALSLVEVIVCIAGFSGTVGAYKGHSEGYPGASLSVQMPFLQSVVFIALLLALLLQLILFTMRFVPQLTEFIRIRKGKGPALQTVTDETAQNEVGQDSAPTEMPSEEKTSDGGSGNMPQF